MILPDRAYAFFSHTHKAQKENMPLLDKVMFSSLLDSLKDNIGWGLFLLTVKNFAPDF